MEIEGYVLVYEFSNEYHPVKTDGKIVFKSEPNALEEIAQTFFRENPRILKLEARFARLDSVYINHRKKKW